MFNYSNGDETRSVSAVTSQLADPFLALCQANNLNSPADLQSYIAGLGSVEELRGLVVMLVNGLLSVEPP